MQEPYIDIVIFRREIIMQEEHELVLVLDFGAQYS
ncbi:MAG: hypothetical protein AWU54_1404, partial [Candidatus Frackibacter sp. T328-2]